MASRELGEVAEYGGVLPLAEDIAIPCGVMKDGTRLLSESGIMGTLGGKRGGSHWRRQKAGITLPVYASAGELRPYVTPELAVKLTHPRIFRVKGQAGYGANGVEASALVDICKVYLDARRDGKLLPSQLPLAARAEILMSALAKTGIDALVDEATGYQEVRQRDELQKLLSKYIAEELQTWTKRFPDEFYIQLFRLRGWDYKTLGMSSHRPRFVGKLTNEIVYERMPKGVLESLKSKNPPRPDGRRKYKHHQFLTEDIGDKHLERMIGADITLMRASNSWPEFIRLLDRAYPKNGTVQGELTIDD
jgi:hypothetical protein